MSDYGTFKREEPTIPAPQSRKETENRSEVTYNDLLKMVENMSKPHRGFLQGQGYSPEGPELKIIPPKGGTGEIDPNRISRSK